jgi:DNA-binding MarR family transcriptional regulator
MGHGLAPGGIDRTLTICHNSDMLGTEVRTGEGEAATRVILSTFRANGLLLSAGDVVAGAEGLTSARWQVLGAIALADRPLTVPQIARRMGLTRQSVHTTVRHLAAEGFVELAPNADHRRSQLVRLTEEGAAAYATLDVRQAAWVNRLAAGIGRSELETAAAVLDELCRRLEADGADRPNHNKGGER